MALGCGEADALQELPFAAGTVIFSFAGCGWEKGISRHAKYDGGGGK